MEVGVRVRIRVRVGVGARVRQQQAAHRQQQEASARARSEREDGVGRHAVEERATRQPDVTARVLEVVDRRVLARCG